MKYIIALNIDDHTPALFPLKAVGRLQKSKQLLQQIYDHLFYTYIADKEIHLFLKIYIIMEGGQTRALNGMDGPRRLKEECYKNHLGMDG